MSNVLERFRKTSTMEFYATGQKLLHEVRSFLMSEKNIPKRERAIYTYPTITLVQNMIDTYMLANSIYAYTPKAVETRKRLFQKSIDMIDPIYMRIQSAMCDLWKDTLCSEPGDPRYTNRVRLEKHLYIIGDLLIREESLLKGCKRKTVLLNN